MASSSRKLHRRERSDHDISPPPTKRKAAAAGTSAQAVANFFTPASQKKEKQREPVEFRVVRDSLLVGTYTSEGERKATPRGSGPLAAFDFDGTLIKTKSGNAFARGAEDWQWWDASVPVRLRKLYAEGYSVVVLSNQNGIVLKPDKASDKKSLVNFKQKATAVLSALDVPHVTIYAATDKDEFRKPRTGMWEQMMGDYGFEAGLERERCVFVGDAAGRQGNTSAKIRKDHSCCDRDFAANVAVPFQTPEEYFLGEEVMPFARDFDPRAYLEEAERTPEPSFRKQNELEIVLFVGSPGAGKSTFFWRYMRPLGYERVNQDQLKTRDKCLRVATAFLSDDRRPVAVDNTNADVETRAAWIRLATQLHVPIRAILFTAPAKVCEHNNTVRALSTDPSLNSESRTLLPKMAFTGFANRFRPPDLAEGLSEISTVDFTFRGSEAEKQNWMRFWLS